MDHSCSLVIPLPCCSTLLADVKVYLFPFWCFLGASVLSPLVEFNEKLLFEPSGLLWWSWGLLLDPSLWGSGRRWLREKSVVWDCWTFWERCCVGCFDLCSRESSTAIVGFQSSSIPGSSLPLLLLQGGMGFGLWESLVGYQGRNCQSDPAPVTPVPATMPVCGLAAMGGRSRGWVIVGNFPFFCFFALSLSVESGLGWAFGTQ